MTIQNPNSKIKNLAVCALWILCGFTSAPPASQPSPIKLEQTIDLPTVEGRIDHMTWDSQRNRLFIAALGNNTVEVIDVAQGKAVDRITRLQRPQGVLYIPAFDNIAVSGGGDGSCQFYKPDTLEIRVKIKNMDDADNLRSDPVKHIVYVGYGRAETGGISLIDPHDAGRLGDIRLGGHPESFQIEQHGQRMFVNVPDAHIVEVVDRTEKKSIAKWPVSEAAANYPMALDEEHKRIFIGCRSPAKLLVLDMDNGKTVASMDCGGDCDDLFYDASSQRIYVSCGAGTVDVFRQKSADSYECVGQVPTAQGARTSLFVPSQHRLYVGAPMSRDKKTSAKVIVFDTQAN